MTSDATKSNPAIDYPGRCLAGRSQVGKRQSFVMLPEARVAFTNIRDIPYAAQYQLFETDRRLLSGRGEGCTQKAARLMSLFTALGLEAEIRRVPFRWSAVLSRLCGIPDRLRSAAAQLGPRWHLFLSVQLPHGRIVVDPTWDRALQHTGLPVNVTFEPNIDMALAVPPDETADLVEPTPLIGLTSCGSANHKDHPSGRASLALHKHYYVFVFHFNRWLAQQRAVSKQG